MFVANVMSHLSYTSYINKCTVCTSPQSVSSPLSPCKRHQVPPPRITLKDLMPEQIVDKDPPTPPVSDSESASPGPLSCGSPRDRGEFRMCADKCNSHLRCSTFSTSFTLVYMIIVHVTCFVFSSDSIQQVGVLPTQSITKVSCIQRGVCVMVPSVMPRP